MRKELCLVMSKGHLPVLHWLAYHLMNAWATPKHDKTDKRNIQLAFTCCMHCPFMMTALHWFPVTL